MSGFDYDAGKKRRCIVSASMRNARGFSKLELLVSVVLIAIFAAVLMNRLRFYQEAAEKANVEYTISALKSALRVKMATMMVQGRMRDYATLENQNPMEWLEKKPSNYRFLQLNEISEKKQTGYWYFDPVDHTLTYWPTRGEYFQPDRSGQKRIRLQVKAVFDDSNVGLGVNGEKPIVTVILNVVEPYHWFN